ncbi:hypothetical protein BS47DRAFT_1351547 [Hydnum rufescens UP504]|uniref:Uncharacterized protein n=1 Tax=Hydnum rufescens UP504 TaxID=1448309 RepID=A0A9P6AKZ5_9AGAM|nr:hypothetical protein BS47DRAFT_1351547 [Hydnum rufescens UP504]
MAVILFNSLGQKGAIALWAFVVIAQCMMGSSTVGESLAAFLATHFDSWPIFEGHAFFTSFLQRLGSLSRSRASLFTLLVPDELVQYTGIAVNS